MNALLEVNNLRKNTDIDHMIKIRDRRMENVIVSETSDQTTSTSYLTLVNNLIDFHYMYYIVYILNSGNSMYWRSLRNLESKYKKKIQWFQK